MPSATGSKRARGFGNPNTFNVPAQVEDLALHSGYRAFDLIGPFIIREQVNPVTSPIQNQSSLPCFTSKSSPLFSSIQSVKADVPPPLLLLSSLFCSGLPRLPESEGSSLVPRIWIVFKLPLSKPKTTVADNVLQAVSGCFLRIMCIYYGHG